MNTRVLIGAPAEIVQAAIAAMADMSLTTADDGAALFAHYSAAVAAKTPPQLVVLDKRLKNISGQAFALAMRALERAWKLPPTAVLFYSEGAIDDELKATLNTVGQAVHLERPAQASPGDQAARLHRAVGRLLERLGAGKA